MKVPSKRRVLSTDGCACVRRFTAFRYINEVQASFTMLYFSGSLLILSAPSSWSVCSKWLCPANEVSRLVM